MRNYLLLAGAVLALAACNPSTPTAPPTPASTDPAKVLTARVPGEWEYSMTMAIIGVHGVPDTMARKILGVKAPSHTNRECLSKPETQADVDKMFDRSDSGCKFTKVAAPPGKIAGTAACSGANGASGSGTVEGSIGATSMDLTMKLRSKMPMPGKDAATLDMLMTMAGKRIGDCPK